MYEIYKDIKASAKCAVITLILAVIILPIWCSFLDLFIGKK
jgi:hypothetical protein